MLGEEVTTTELLGAYLNGDVTVAERAAVEAYLASDTTARLQLSELRALNVTLKAGDREARVEALDRLRNTVLKIVQQRQIQAALISGIAGEQDGIERALAEEQLKSNPNARAELAGLVALSQRLKNDGDRVASDDLSAKLRMRLNAALPAAALEKKAHLNGHVASERAVTAGFATIPAKASQPSDSPATKTTSASSTSQRPSLRIFVKREDPWKKRALIMGSMAALLAVFAGVNALRGTGETTAVIHNKLDVPGPVDPKINEHGTETPRVPAPVVDNSKHSNDTNLPPVAPNEIVRQTPPNENKGPAPVVPPERIVAPDKTPEVVKDRNVVAPENNAPRDTIKNVPPLTPVPQPNVARQDNSTPTNPPPKNTLPPINNDTVVAVGPGVTPNVFPNVTPNVTPIKNGGPPILTPNSNPGVATNTPPLVGPNTTTPSKNPGTTGVRPPMDPSVAINNPPKNPNGLAPTDDNTKPTVGNGTATVAKLSGAGVAQMTVAGKKQALAKDMTIPSGAAIETGDSLVALVLPDDVHLYINGNSTATLNIGKSVTVSLQSGEVYYVGKGVTVIAGKITIELATEADVSIAGVVRAGNLNDKKMKVTADGVKKSRDDVPNGTQAVVPADASDVIKEEAVPATPGNWRQPVLLDGDGLKSYTNTRARSNR